MELRQLRHFVAVAEHRNFSRAADALDISQQALSYSISQLEKQLGAKLFSRGQFGADLTELGTAFVLRARLILAEIQLAELEVQALQDGSKGHVRLGCGRVVAERVLPAVITRFREEHPEIKVTVRVDNSTGLFAGLLAGQLDFAVTTPMESTEQEGELRHEPAAGVIFDPNYVCMRWDHPLATSTNPSLADFRDYAWVLPETLAPHRHAIFQAFSNAGLPPPDYHVRTDSIAFCKSLLMQTDFVAMLGRHSILTEEKHKLLRGHRLPGLNLHTQAYFSYRRRFPLQASAKFLMSTFEEVLAKNAVQHWLS